jgi:glycosyltransferase involved in cell wall biosynthesis
MPSLFESVSIPIYEALSAGTPVAASGILAIPEQLDGAGLLFDPHSSASMASTILRLLEDVELARRLKKHGRARMASITVSRFSNQLQNLLVGLSGE